MKKLLALVIAFAFIFNILVFAEDTAVGTWRSILYPEDWVPGFTTEGGLFLQDYSYAGYHMGEDSVPTGDIGEIFNVTDPLYGADNTGAVDSTLAIQSAIDAAQLAGGGTIYLPEGTYKVSPIETGRVFTITHSNILIKGDGVDKTKIYNTDPYMRMTTIFNFCPTGFVDWASLDEFNVAKVTEDLKELDNVIPVESVADYKVGDWIFIKIDATKDFIAEHGQTNLWKTDIQPIQYYRQVIHVDEVSKTLTIDIPVRYTLKMRDSARVFRSNVAHLEEVGIKDMSFGMLENIKAGLAEEDYTTEGTAAYDSHLSRLIGITHTVNGWITNIGTFKPAENTKDIHIISDGIDLRFCRSVTVDGCNIQKPLYEGGGGNGYLFNLKGQECLIINCYAYHGRHNYSFGGMYCSGNVLTASTSATAKKETDHHLHLAHANLLDSMIMKGDQIEAINRNSYGSTNRHGQTSTQVVFWNSKGDSYQGGESALVETQQFGMGYVVGTKGAAYKVSAYEGDSTSPMDFVEGVGTGDTLVPQSLYLDQLKRRIAAGGKPNVIAKYPDQGKRLYEGSYVYFEFDRAMNATTINEQSVDIVPSAKIDVKYDAVTKRVYVSFPDGMEAEREYAVTLNAESILSQDDNSPMYNSTIRFTASEKAYEATAFELNNEGSTAKAKATVLNNFHALANMNLCIAAFSKATNQLKDISVVQIQVPVGSDNSGSTESVNAGDNIADCYYKAFCWDDNMLPVALPIKKLATDVNRVAINPTDDAFTRNGTSYQNTNYGANELLGLKYGNAGYKRYVYIKFTLPEEIASVQKATLRLYGGTGIANSKPSFNIYQIADDWDEVAVTWSNAPGMGNKIVTATSPDVKAYIEIDVTDYVISQVETDRIISMGMDTGSSDYIGFNSKEALENRPELVLIY